MLLAAAKEDSLHHEIRDFTAELMSEVCYVVGTEPSLQSVTDKHTTYPQIGDKVNGAHLDIVAENFAERDRQHTF